MESRFHTAIQIGLILLLVAVPLAAQQAGTNSALLNPSSLTETAPDRYTVNFETSLGDIEIRVNKDWAPLGADRFYNLVKNGFYDECRFFRVVPNFVVQFGMPADPAVSKAWANANIQDDPVKRGNTRGRVVFATSGPNTRTTQIFININDNSYLDDQGFAAFGEVRKGMDLVTKINAEYGEGPNQGMIRTQGNAYLNENFPKLDYIIKATIVE
jgi:peptidyl-prolyl cis-trans isomerase A (cyclophilin A)